MQVQLSFLNYDRNLQIAMPTATGLELTLYYSSHKEAAGSVGGVLIGVTFGCFIMYMAIGAAIKIKKFGAEPGKEAIPQREFWAAIPGLAKDGIRFTVFKLCGKQMLGANYETI
jgi:hypothetical protein